MLFNAKSVSSTTGGISTLTKDATRPGLFKRWWLRHKALRRGQPLVRWRLSCNENELVAVWESVDGSSEGEHRLQWSDVREVAAFKRDCWVHDLLMVQFQCADGATLKVHEEMYGFESAMRSLPNFLVGCRPYDDWWHPVVVPAFATNWTVIWTGAGDPN